MIEPIEWLRTLILVNPSLLYLIIFLGVAFGGELVIFTLAFLVAQNLVPVVPFIVLSYLGTLFTNTIWFLLGKTTMATKVISHRYLNTTISMITQAVVRASKGSRLIGLTIVKFLVGTSFILIMYTNKTKLGWKEFFPNELVAIFLSILAISSIGYISGLGFSYLAIAFNNLYLAIGFILIVLIGITMLQIRFEKKFTEESSF